MPILTFASGCSRDGYTVITINGMITTPEGAVYNKKQIAKVVPEVFNKQKVYVDYVYNESHVLGLVDFIDSANQKVMENFVYPTYDLDKMLGDLSDKVDTQKLLLVAHSQGNFYANDIYNSIASKKGGVPKESMAIYGIGTPTSYIAGGGKYILSSNDQIMNWVRLWGFLDVLPANVVIEGGQEGDDKRGHNLSTIYLKYQGQRIAKEISESLMTLKENNIQTEDSVCIIKKDLPFFHKVVEVFYKVVDPISIFIKDTLKENLSATEMEDILIKLPASAGDFSKEEEKMEEEEIQKELPKEEVKKELVVEPKIEQKIDDLVLETNEVEEVKEEKKKTSSSHHHSSRSSDDNKEEDKEEVIEEEDNSEQEETNDEVEEEEVIDSTPPLLVLNGESHLSLEKNSVYAEEGATATDETDGPVLVVIEGLVDTTMIGKQTVTYKATDSSGNVSTLARTIEIFEPTINLIVDKDTELTSGEYNFNQVIVRNNSTLKLLGQPDGDLEFRGVKIIANNIIVEEGSKISADYEGYFLGPGSVDSKTFPNNGMSYGGKGGGKESLGLYGSALRPIDLGSGVDSSNRGGGAIWLEVREKLTNNGVISANGSLHSSGGSIYVTTNKLEGIGEFKTNGGWAIWQRPSSAGGGGRIAIYYSQLDFSGNAVSEGGSICNSGCYKVGKDGTVGLFDLENNSLKIISTWRFEKNNSPYSFKDIVLSSNSIVESEEGVVINGDNLYLTEGSSFSVAENKDFTFSNISLDNSNLDMKEGGRIETRKVLIDNNSRITLGGEDLKIKGMNIINGSTLTTQPEKVLFLDLDDLTIGKDSYINADAKGYFAGPGTPTEEARGGLYGGDDFNNRELVYGSSVRPTDFGSAGTALYKRGGGAIHIIAGNFINDGIITASGGASASGGSILVEAFNLSGTGLFKANGGSYHTTTVIHAPGGGGRIALHGEYTVWNSKLEVLGGCVSYDGTNLSCAPAGTAGFFDEHYGILKLENSWEFRKIDNNLAYNKIEIYGKVNVKAEDGVSIKANSVFIEGVSTLTLSGGVLESKEIYIYDRSTINTRPEKAINIIATDLLINKTSKITADNMGYLVGPGTPEDGSTNGSSYGGWGGGDSPASPYGSDTEPLDFGSGTSSARGGGAIHIKVEKSLTNEGEISARGTKVRTTGGSIYIETGSLSGDGLITANGSGGYESNPSIGGSGGRIAISHGRDFYFTGEVTASAGSYYSKNYRPEEQDGTIKIIPRFVKVSDYSLNWEKQNVTVTPTPDESVSIFIKTNQEVDWVSVQVKNKEDGSIYKTFQDGSGCLDGTNNCLKSWDGTLSKNDKNLISGNYQIVVKVKDLKTGEEITEILPSEIIVILPTKMMMQTFLLEEKETPELLKEEVLEEIKTEEGVEEVVEEESEIEEEIILSEGDEQNTVTETEVGGLQEEKIEGVVEGPESLENNLDGEEIILPEYDEQNEVVEIETEELQEEKLGGELEEVEPEEELDEPVPELLITDVLEVQNGEEL